MYQIKAKRLNYLYKRFYFIEFQKALKFFAPNSEVLSLLLKL